jgi:hypothetical protein
MSIWAKNGKSDGDRVTLSIFVCRLHSAMTCFCDRMLTKGTLILTFFEKILIAEAEMDDKIKI